VDQRVKEVCYNPPLNKGAMGLFTKSKEPEIVKLDESKIPPEIENLENRMKEKVAGQDRAIQQFVRVHETYLAGMAAPDRPLGVFLFVGPTGSGKTHATEIFAELTGAKLIKIDCAEYQHSHEISKLIGSPPGYVGGEIDPKLSKKAIEERWGKSGPKYTVILFDEIEKAHNSMHQILLGIMDRATLSTGKNETIDMHNTILVFTSNLGSGDVGKILTDTKEMGFVVAKEKSEKEENDIYRVAKDAVKKFFSAEFFNRIDRMIVFQPLTEPVLRRILEIELKRVQDRILKANKFVSVDISNRGRDFLIVEGTSKLLGARELRRTLERFLVSKLTRAFATKQAEDGDMIIADKVPGTEGLVLDISKKAMILPEKDPITGAPVNPTSGGPVVDERRIVKQSKAARVEPDDPKAWIPYESLKNPGYCAKCGYGWHTAHKCFDPSDFGCGGGTPFDKFRQELEKKKLEAERKEKFHG